MTKTKQGTEKPWDDEDDSIQEDDISSIDIADSGIDSVVNVEFVEITKSVSSLRLELMKIVGDEGRYYSSTYVLSTKYNSNGLFDFLDDYYSKKFTFFASGKRNQAFLMALHKLERKFYKNMCFDFKDYCEKINDSAIEKITKDSRFSNVTGIRIVDGYSIGDESSAFYNYKNDGIKVGNHIEEFGIALKKEFDSILSEMEKSKFCCICINSTEKLPPSFLIDPTVGLPLVVYNKDFAELFLRKNFREFIESNLMELAEISSLKIDLWAVAADTIVKTLLGIIGEDGELKIPYDDESMEDSDVFLGKYKTLTFSKRTYKKEIDDHQTVIGFN